MLRESASFRWLIVSMGGYSLTFQLLFSGLSSPLEPSPLGFLEASLRDICRAADAAGTSTVTAQLPARQVGR